MMRYFALACLSFTLFACPAPAAEEPFFPIMAWNHVPGDAAVIKKMKECGLTIAGFVHKQHLDLVHAAGMKAVLYDERTAGYDWTNVDADKARKNVTSLIDEIGSHPAIIGYYLRDEPPGGYFAGLEKVASVIREKSPGKWPYINLFPNYADGGQLQTKDYREYLDKFVETCKPPILSYDHYTLMEGGSMRERYFENLEQMRDASVRHKIPFWNIVQATAALDFREVNAADLRFQAFTTLAYGGRGLSWFTYFSSPTGNFRAAPIDQFGNENPSYRSMQQVNLQILKLAPTMLKLTSDRVYHFGKLPPGTSAPDDKSLITALDANMFAGDFTHEDGSRWVMIVNRDLNGSHYCAPTFRSPPKSIQKLNSFHGQLGSFVGEDCWLAPGQGVLLKLE